MVETTELDVALEDLVSSLGRRHQATLAPGLAGLPIEYARDGRHDGRLDRGRLVMFNYDYVHAYVRIAKIGVRD